MNLGLYAVVNLYKKENYIGFAVNKSMFIIKFEFLIYFWALLPAIIMHSRCFMTARNRAETCSKCKECKRLSLTTVI